MPLLARILLPRARLSRRSSSLAASQAQTLTLADGRTLAFEKWGDPTHPPLLFLHGFPGSRLEVSALAPRITSQRVFLISPDRPGFGHSSPSPRPSIPGYAADVAALLDHLSLPRAAMLGGSGGGPYALACGASVLTRPRLAALGVLAGAPPWVPGVGRMPLSSRALRAACTAAPGLTGSVAGAAVRAARYAAWAGRGRIEAWLERQGVPKDRVGAAREEMVRMMFEGFAQGPEAAVVEAILLSQEWGFDLAEVRLQLKGEEEKPVRIWHGREDARAPIAFIRYMARQIPHARLVEMEGGHFDVHACLDDVVQTLLSDAEWGGRK